MFAGATPTPSFVLNPTKDARSCTIANLMEITNAVDCQRAAKSLGYQFAKAHNEDDRPYGCSLHGVKDVWFNTRLNPTRPKVGVLICTKPSSIYISSGFVDPVKVPCRCHGCPRGSASTFNKMPC